MIIQVLSFRSVCGCKSFSIEVESCDSQDLEFIVIRCNSCVYRSPSKPDRGLTLAVETLVSRAAYFGVKEHKRVTDRLAIGREHSLEFYQFFFLLIKLFGSRPNLHLKPFT